MPFYYLFVINLINFIAVLLPKNCKSAFGWVTVQRQYAWFSVYFKTNINVSVNRDLRFQKLDSLQIQKPQMVHQRFFIYKILFQLNFNNCYNVEKVFSNYCRKLILVLDWFLYWR